MAPPSLILRVAVPSPLYRIFDYLAPQQHAPSTLQAGIRVRVPFGASEHIGVVVAIATTSDIEPARLKEVSELLDDEPLLPRELLDLVRWAADYYQHPLGEVLSSIMPVLLRAGHAAVIAPRRGWQLSAAGHDIEPDSLKKARRQQALMQLLRRFPTGVSREQLVDQPGDWRRALKILVDKGWVDKCVLGDELPAQTAAHLTLSPPTVSPPSLNEDQRQAVDAVVSRLGSFS
ncbi:MAG: primosomal protein N', partial [Gammaproteobacteria bacterium]|nr:primosomal protein N' [Gammaproteobacteria bacterium]